ncbi:MAG: hypothetical protein H8M99_08105, partial [Gloeobacteraceae cyanobacterium ES-bin-144]|nr:hypothetical protein [Verrucomicrobiales bacterium]
LNLLAVVGISIGFQIWSHHNAWLAGFLKTTLLPASDCLLLLALSTLPLIALETRKALLRRSAARQLV